MTSTFDLSDSDNIVSRSPQWNYMLKLLEDPTISEIETNGPSEFFVKKSGKRLAIPNLSFPTEDAYAQAIERDLVPLVRHFDDYVPNGYLFEGPLHYTAQDGQLIKGRCHIVLPPASDVPQVTIAKKTASLTTLEKIAGRGSMCVDMLQFLQAAIAADFTIVFSGGTGAGKTTMLEACTKLIRRDSRIGVAEDTPELVLQQENVTYLHSVPWKPGMDVNEVASLAWVVQQFQRMRTDRLIIGETRGKEFADFLVAANSGMEGSMTTIHADNPVRCLDKMTNFALKGSDKQPVRSINMDIAKALDVIVQLIILPDGRHKVASISEVTDTLNNNEDARITTNPLYTYHAGEDMFSKKSPLGEGLRNKFTAKGINIDNLIQTPLDHRMAPLSIDAASGPSHPADFAASRGIPTNRTI